MMKRRKKWAGRLRWRWWRTMFEEQEWRMVKVRMEVRVCGGTKKQKKKKEEKTR